MTKKLAIKENITPFEKKAVKQWATTLDIDLVLAKQILLTEEGHTKYQNFIKKKLDLDLYELIDKTQTAYERKVTAGSGGQARQLAMAIGILRTKAFGPDDKKIGMQISGKQVQVNVGFGFKPYKKKK